MQPAPPADQVLLRQFRFVFVVAYARSGSTLLQSLLNSCEGVQIRGENNNALFHLFNAIMAADKARRFGYREETRQPDQPWFGAPFVRPGLFQTGLLLNFLRHVLAPDPQMRVTGFKEIRYNSQFIPAAQFAPYMDFLLAQFPGARVVFNSRRAEDVAKSAFVARQGPKVVADWVRETDAAFAEYAAKSDRCIHMRYEDYVQDHSLVHRMLEFLELDWTPDAVERVFAKPLTHAKPEAAD